MNKSTSGRPRTLTEKVAKNQQSVLNVISYHILNSDSLKKSPIINLKSAKYNNAEGVLTIGFSTVEGKYGTVLELLNKSNRELSDYIFSLNMYFKPPKIVWVIVREDPDVLRVQALLDKIQEDGTIKE